MLPVHVGAIAHVNIFEAFHVGARCAPVIKVGAVVHNQRYQIRQVLQIGAEVEVGVVGDVQIGNAGIVEIDVQSRSGDRIHATCSSRPLKRNQVAVTCFQRNQVPQSGDVGTGSKQGVAADVEVSEARQ